MGISVEMERSVVALLVLAALCACAAMAETQEEVQQLQDSKYDPSVDAKHMNEVNKIRDFKSMTQYIAGRVKEVQKAELAKKFNGENEEIAIGNTLKSMEAKHAVEAELNSEVKIDCEVGAWSKFGACNKLCDGGKMSRKRIIATQPRNGGKACPPTENTIDCNTESCSSEAYARRAARRKLTAAEKRREMAANNIKIRMAMRATSVKDMKRKTREIMRKLVHTHMATVKLPGEKGPRNAESLVRTDLKVAMAKNAVNKAMDRFSASRRAGKPKE